MTDTVQLVRMVWKLEPRPGAWEQPVTFPHRQHKDGDEIEVDPSAVAAHEELGWVVVNAPA